MRIDRPVSQRQSWWLLATALAAGLPLAQQVPPALVVGCGVLMVWRALITWRGWRLPPRWLLVPLSLAATAALLWHFRTFIGRTPGVTLLVLFITLKLLELRIARDALALVLLAYFLVLSHFMYSQSIGTAVMAVGAVLITTATLAAAMDDRPAPARQIRQAGLMLLQGIPFMLLLFILFPRIDGPLWGLPQDRHAATTGLSDTVSPGTIAQLSQSDAVAFRVRFDGPPPAQDQLYWRGPVMPDFDGSAWRVANSDRRHPEPPYPVTAADDDSRYELTLEPHGKHWLFALEFPLALPAESVMTRDLQILSKTPVRSRLRYTLRSQPATSHATPPSPRELAESLRLPASGNSRTRAIAAQWRADAEAALVKEKLGAGETAPSAIDAAILARAEDFFLRQFLRYTLTPPLLGRDSVDEFLFETKSGFCEHFASAFAFALRAAGVPARMVAGYQGGELNPIDGYLVVRQYDAHAWTEVWLEGRGWVRVDPTAISLPRRIADHFGAALPEGEPVPLFARQDLAWLRDLRHRLDAVANGWNQWVLGYNAARQREFLREFGLDATDWKTLGAWLSVLCGAMMLGLAGLILWQRRARDPVQAQWQRFTRRLARRGVAWHPWEGPRDFATRATAALPAQAAAIEAITADYIALRYAPPASRAQVLSRLRQRVRRFRP